MKDLARDINRIIETAVRQSMTNTLRACREGYLLTRRLETPEAQDRAFFEFLETLDSTLRNK